MTTKENHSQGEISSGKHNSLNETSTLTKEKYPNQVGFKEGHKPLNEMKCYNPYGKFWYLKEEELKQEAIKWVKYFEGDSGKLVIGYEFRKFFNITESDIQEADIKEEAGSLK